jgi:phosphate acetyltransferase
MFEYEQMQRAQANQQHIVLPEGTEERILHAAEILLLRNVVKLTLLGNVEEIQQKIKKLGLHLDDVNIIDPLHYRGARFGFNDLKSRANRMLSGMY